MTYETITLVKQDHVSMLTLNRPERLNALNDQMARELMDVLTTLTHDDDTRVLIITGEGRAFCTGGDQKERQNKLAASQDTKTDYTAAFAYKGCMMLRDLGKPVIAAINGPAVGFGFSLALASDIRIASDEARFAVGFVSRAYSPGFGLSYFLPRLVGLGKASELAFTNKMIKAHEAKELGIVNQVTTPVDLIPTVEECASQIAESAPTAIQLTKKALHASLENTLDSQLEFESICRSICKTSWDHKEAVDAFVEKRKASFKGL